MTVDTSRWEMELVETQDDVDRYRRWLEWACGECGVFAIDTETIGFRWTDRAFTRLFQIAADDYAWAIPVEWYGRLIHETMHTVINRGVSVVFHNAGFDQHALEGDGFPAVPWDRVHDTYVMHHLLYPVRRHDLKGIGDTEVGPGSSLGSALLKAKFRELGVGWENVPVDLPEYWAYGCIDTLLTWHLMRVLGPRVSAAGLLPAYDREMHIAAVMYRAEVRGMRVDTQYAAQLRDKWTIEAAALKRELQEAGIKNPNSNRQIESVFRQNGWEPEEFTDTGQAVLDKVVLAELSATYPEIAPLIVRFKRLTKWIGAYLDHFVDGSVNGRVHPGIHTLRARTGRMSITEPALQTLPSKGSSGAIRRCIIPDTGHALWAVDYDGQEARIFAHYSGDEGMRAAYEAGDDLYTHVARIVWNDPGIQKDDPRRGVAKVILLAFTYGAGVDKLSAASGLPPEEVKIFLRQLFTEFPSVRDLTGDHSIGGSFSGYPAEEVLGRLSSEGLGYLLTSGGRRFQIKDEDEAYKAVNGLCQGSAKDVLSSAVVRIDRAGLGDNIVIPIHDELLAQFPKGDEEGPAEFARLMEDHGWSIPLTVEATGPLKHWGEAYE